MVCRSICNLPSEAERSDDKLNVEDEDEEADDEEDDDDTDMSSSLLPSDCDSFKDQKQLSSMSDKVSIMVCRALFSSVQIASHIMRICFHSRTVLHFFNDMVAGRLQ